jgi:hypothetical protein
VGYLCNFHKTLGENSHNLVALVGSDAGQLCPGPIEAMKMGGGICGMFFFVMLHHNNVKRIFKRRGGSGLIFFGLGSGLGFILWARASSGWKNLLNKSGFSWARALLHK